jgi:hypothetical protein
MFGISLPIRTHIILVIITVIITIKHGQITFKNYQKITHLSHKTTSSNSTIPMDITPSFNTTLLEKLLEKLPLLKITHSNNTLTIKTSHPQKELPIIFTHLKTLPQKIGALHLTPSTNRVEIQFE